MIESLLPGYVQFGEFGKSISEEEMKMVHALNQRYGLQNLTKPGESSIGMYLMDWLLPVGESLRI